MSAVTIIIDIVLIIIAIILILTVLMQQGQRQGLGAIGGGAETFFGKNKAKSYEGKLAMLTKICAVLFIVLAMVATIVAGSNDSPAVADDTGSAITSDEETTDDGETDEPVVTDEPTDEADPTATDASDVDEAAAGEPSATDDVEATEEPVEE